MTAPRIPPARVQQNSQNWQESKSAYHKGVKYPGSDRRFFFCMKLEKRNYDITLENLEEHIHDMVGVRLVCPFEDDVYEMVDLIKSSDLLQVCHEKDYIENPKESGYSSYHIIVKVPVSFKDDIEFIDAEIQVRTLAMDAWAALEHELQYKSNGSVTKRERDELRECAQEFRRIENKMLTLKKGLR